MEPVQVRDNLIEAQDSEGCVYKINIDLVDPQHILRVDAGLFTLLSDGIELRIAYSDLLRVPVAWRDDRDRLVVCILRGLLSVERHVVFGVPRYFVDFDHGGVSEVALAPWVIRVLELLGALPEPANALDFWISKLEGTE